MSTTPTGTPTGTPVGTTTGASSASQAAEQLKKTLATADDTVNQGIQNLGLVHQARLSQATRTAADLKAQYGADDPRVVAAEASVTATKTTVARVAMVQRQSAAPAVQVAKAGWALHGHLLDAQLQPVAKFTVFLVDANKTYLGQYGFAYTDANGYFLINYAGGQAPSAAQLFVEVANTDANPVYLSSAPFQPVLGAATFQDIVLPAGGQAIGDPPPPIRTVALPTKPTVPTPVPTNPTPGPTKPTAGPTNPTVGPTKPS